MTRWLPAAALACLAVVLAPAAAWACPSCAAFQSNDDFYWFLGAMILLPFPTAGVVLWVIRRSEAEREADASVEPSTPNPGQR